MLDDLRARLRGDGALVAGVLSGTSADGIDVGLVRVRARGSELELGPVVAFETSAFEPTLRARVRAVLDGAPCGLRESALLSRDLGRAFGDAARTLAERAGVVVDLVGSHGQTVWHHDGRTDDGKATLQLGDGDHVAEASGCTTVSDFRQRDVAAGGEGAPLSALADPVIFARVPRPCAVLNLGGMGNLTVLREHAEDVLAFDTGPANSLLDGLARRFLHAPCDRDGASAARGRVDEGWVAELLSHPFFATPVPRSTGRDTFGEPYVDAVVERARARGLLEHGPDDLFASATAFVAATVAESLARFVSPRADRLVVAGGGVHNRALMLALYERCGIPVGSSAAAGVDPDARESLLFAVLAAACVLEIPLSHPGATGAPRGRCLGKISLGGTPPDRLGTRPGSGAGSRGA